MNSLYKLHDKIKNENENAFVFFEEITEGGSLIRIIKEDALYCINSLDFSFVLNENEKEIIFLKVNINYFLKIILSLRKSNLNYCLVKELTGNDSRQLQLF